MPCADGSAGAAAGGVACAANGEFTLSLAWRWLLIQSPHILEVGGNPPLIRIKPDHFAVLEMNW